MMLPTHVLAGLAAAAPVAAIVPELGPAALAGAVLGSLLPDLDLYAGHRRTLHFPTGYTAVAVPGVLVAGVVASPAVVLLAMALVGAALHCRMDRYGGGLELKPWEGTSDRAVYDHVRGTWLAPRRWIRYDGAPEDVYLALGLAAVLLAVLQGPVEVIVIGAAGVGTVYGLLRRQLAALAPVVAGAVPQAVAGHVPDRYRP